MVFKVFFFVTGFLPSVPSYHPASLPPGVMLLNHSTTPRDSITDIEKTSRKGALKREQPNRSVVKIYELVYLYKTKGTICHKGWRINIPFFTVNFYNKIIRILE